MSVKIGIMSFAHLHADSYAHCLRQLGAEFIGVADHDPERAGSKAQQFGVRAFGSYEALLASDVQAVVVCSENIKHTPLVLQAAQAGKHIICEKPLMTRLEDGQAMIEACRQAGVQLFTAFPCRFSPAMAQLKAIVESGEIGDLLAMKGTNRGSNPGGWFNIPELSGGGAMIDHTVHVTDLMRWMTGQEVVEVYAETGNNMFHGDYDDTAMLTLTFGNDLFATLDSSWSRPRTFPTWGDVTLSVVGTRGYVEMDMFAQYTTYYNDKSGRVQQAFWGDNIDLGMVGAFLHAIETGEKGILATGEDGYQAAGVALAAYESVKRKEPVKL
jgi:predicted dehydrogenase